MDTKTLSEISIPEVTVLTVESLCRDSSKIMCTVQISVCETTQNVELMLDTGSAVSIIPMSMCNQYFLNSTLVKAKVNLVSSVRWPYYHIIMPHDKFS